MSQQIRLIIWDGVNVDMIKIIFSDMDGTLLDENSQLPRGFDETISKLKARGVIFAPASGRQYFSLIRTFDKYKDDFLFLAENGTLVMYQGKEISSSPMPYETALDILSIGENWNDIFRVFCGKKNTYFLESQNNPTNQAELDKYFTQHKMVKKFSDVKDDVPIKVSYYDHSGNAANSTYPPIKAKFGDTMQVVLASEYWTDIINPDVSKGAAIRNVQKVLGITPDECAAFGDYLNDVQMMQAVTHSFAMANSHPDLKKFAKYETVSNSEYGVLVGIEKLMEQGLI